MSWNAYSIAVKLIELLFGIQTVVVSHVLVYTYQRPLSFSSMSYALKCSHGNLKRFGIGIKGLIIGKKS